MTPELWQRVCEVLAALEPLSADERTAELARLRSSEPVIAAEIEGLLAAEVTAGRLDLDGAIANAWEQVGELPTTAIAEGRDNRDEHDCPTAAYAAPVEHPDITPPDVPGYVLKGGKENVRIGGMGVVYFGSDKALGRSVAVKVLRKHLAHDQQLVARFEAEARINAQLQHPGIVPVHQIGKLADGRSFYTMKRVKGETFSDVLKRRESPSANLLDVLGQFRLVCEAMAYAHARNVLHRDLKPQNVMVGEYGEVLLMDWGLAKVLGDYEMPEPTPEPPSRAINVGSEGNDREPTQGMLGTLPYMAPEAASQIDLVDKRSDVFGLGAILCTILTGQPPYIGASDRWVERKVREGDLDEAYSRIAACGADPELVALARRCLAQRREQRPVDASEVANAVAGYLAGVEERRRRAELDRVKAEAETKEQKKRRRIQLALVASLGLLVSGGGAFAWREDKRATDRRLEIDKQESDQRLDAEMRYRDQLEHKRVARVHFKNNTSALERLVGEAEDALRSGGSARRVKARVDEANERMKEPCGEAVAVRLEQCRTDLAVLTELIRIESFRWTPGVTGNYPVKKEVVSEWRSALKSLGVVSDDISVEESAKRIRHSLVRDRLLMALNLWLVFEPSDKIRAILRLADPDEHREQIRDAILGGGMRKDHLVNLARQPQVLNQPGWFAAAFGQIPAIPVARRREVMEMALRGHTNDLTLLMSLGKTYPINKREGAENRLRWFQAAVAAYTQCGAAHNNLGIALSDMGDKEGAIRAYKTAIELDKYNPYPHNNLGTALKAKNEVDEAIKEYRIAIELNPKFALAHTNLGSALRAKEDLAGAIREHRIAIELNPKLPAAHNGLGIALKAKGQLDEAIQEYREAIRLDPKYARPHNNLGYALQEKGELEEAIKEYREAIKLDPKYANPHNGLGSALEAKGELDEAIKEYREAIKLNPNSALGHHNLGNALKAKGELEEASKEYRLANQLDPKYAIPQIPVPQSRAEIALEVAPSPRVKKP